jgi:hypothetical protein
VSRFKLLPEPPKIYAQISDELNQAIINGMNIDARDRPDSMSSWLKFSKKLENTHYSSQFNSEFEEEYKHLENFLMCKKWINADIQTNKLMLKIADREIQGWMGIEEWNIFPCRDLKMIDKLWHDHSQGHFGFSTQKNIWELVDRDWNRFENEVWWIDDQDIEMIKRDLYRYFTKLLGANKNKLIRGEFPTVAKPKTGILLGKIDSEEVRQRLIIDLQEYLIQYRQTNASTIAKEKRCIQQYKASQINILSWRQKSDSALRGDDKGLLQETLNRLQLETSTSKYSGSSSGTMYCTSRVDIYRQ